MALRMLLRRRGFRLMPRGRDLTDVERRRIERLQQRALDAERASRRALEERDAALAQLAAAGVSVVRISNALDLSEQAVRLAIKRGQAAT